MSVVRHMFNESFGTQKTMVTSISKVEPRKGQVPVRLGQIRPNFEIQKFLTKTWLSYLVLSQDSTNEIYSYVRQIEIPIIAFLKSDVITFTCFFLPTIAQPNIKILPRNLVCVLLVCILTMYFLVFG